MQVLIDNLVYSPVFNLLVMAYIGTVVEGKQLAMHSCNVSVPHPSRSEGSLDILICPRYCKYTASCVGTAYCICGLSQFQNSDSS